MENINLSEFIQIKQKLETLKSLYDSYEKEEESLNSKLILLNDSLKVVRLSKHYKIESRKKFILDIINQALMIVFDSRYHIDIVSEEKSTNKFNIKYKLVLYKDGKDVSSNNELYETSGGGVLTVISFVLKILLGYINSKNKFFILDEVFSQISREYRSGIAKLLRILSDKYGFTFLIISHEGLEQEDVDLVYHASSEKDEDGFNKLVLIREYSKQKEITAPYYKVDIENFQAIKKTSLIIKGVTVIHGATDSGKSAIQRAIRSLITNSFNVNLYPRWRKKRTKLTTKIRLTKVFEETEEFVELEYRDKVIYRSHTGDEFVGKKLASSNIFEILEKFGFAQIPKESIDKLTGELKQQTQRIFVTTQFDKLYLAEDRNGLEKIFSIIFDSHLFNQLESAINSDILATEKELKSVFAYKEDTKQKIIQTEIEGYQAFNNIISDISSQKSKINLINDQVRMLNELSTDYDNLIKQYNLLKTINTIKDTRNKLSQISHEINSTSERFTTISNIVNLYQQKHMIADYQTKKESYKNLLKSIDTLTIRKEFSNQIIIFQKINLLRSTKKSIDQINSTKEDISIKIETLNELINLLNISKNITQYQKLKLKTFDAKPLIEKINVLDQLIKLYELKNLSQKYQKILSTKSELTTKLEGLSEKYNLQVCKCCNGIGYTT